MNEHMDSPWDETPEQHIHSMWHERFEEHIQTHPDEFKQSDLKIYDLMTNGEPVEDLNQLLTEYEQMVRRYRDIFQDFEEPEPQIWRYI